MSYFTNIYNRLFGRPNDEPIKLNLTGHPYNDIINLLNDGFYISFINEKITIDDCDYFVCYCTHIYEYLNKNRFIIFIMSDDFIIYYKSDLTKNYIECNTKLAWYCDWTGVPFTTINYTKPDLSKLKFCRINQQTKDIIHHYYKMLAPPTITYN